jgi:hypothetical protein
VLTTGLGVEASRNPGGIFAVVSGARLKASAVSATETPGVFVVSFDFPTSAQLGSAEIVLWAGGRPSNAFNLSANVPSRAVATN